MGELYGDLPFIATKEIIDIADKEDANLYELWASFGKFLYDYYGKHEGKNKIIGIAKQFEKSFKDQHHSGYSHGVVTQCIMEYLCGKMSEKNKQKIRGKTIQEKS